MRFVIELRYTDDGVHGHVASDAAPEPQPFVGWLELLRLLEPPAEGPAGQGPAVVRGHDADERGAHRPGGGRPGVGQD